jgi:hypothetical protein
MVMVPREVCTLFAIANVLWRAVFTISRVKYGESVVEAVHVMVTTPPVVAPVGVLRVRAETRGRARASTLSLANILVVDVKKRIKVRGYRARQRRRGGRGGT